MFVTPPSPPVYLDHNATTPGVEEWESFIKQALSFMGNPSSVHAMGRRARHAIEEARQTITSYFGTSTASVVFTSGATEANNLALKGFKGAVLISAMEHESVYQCRPDAFVCPVDHQGLILLDALEAWLKQTPGPKLISVMAANNETGVLQPLKQIAILGKTHGAFVHCDGVQAVQKTNTNWAALGIDMISLSGHKIGALQGVGALIFNNNKIPLMAQMVGGGQERSLRAGTENVIGILSLKNALEKQTTPLWQATEKLRNSLEEKLQSLDSRVVIFGQKAPRLPNTTALTMPGVSSAIQVMNFDLKGICVSAGAACSSGKVKSSRVLQAMKINPTDADCALRISLGPTTTPKEIDYFISVWTDFYNQLSCPSLEQRKRIL